MRPSFSLSRSLPLLAHCQGLDTCVRGGIEKVKNSNVLHFCYITRSKHSFLVRSSRISQLLTFDTANDERTEARIRALATSIRILGTWVPIGIAKTPYLRDLGFFHLALVDGLYCTLRVMNQYLVSTVT